MDASVRTPVTRTFLPSSRAMVSPFGGRRWRLSRRAADPDEHRVRPVDLPELDGRAGPRGVDLQVAAGVEGHVSGPPHEVARLCLVSRDHRADVALAGRAAGEGDAQLGEHVGREPGAVEAVRGGAPVDVRRTDVAGGDLQDGTTDGAGRYDADRLRGACGRARRWRRGRRVRCDGDRDGVEGPG